MDIQLELARQEEAPIIARLWPLYQYDLSEVGGTPINAYGLFEDEGAQDWLYTNILKVWWDKPDSLFPFLIRVEGRAAGFTLVSTSAYAPAGCDFCLHEFFVLRSFRGRGVAEQAASAVFSKFSGRWELGVMPNNHRALAFWRKTLRQVMSGSYCEAMRSAEDASQNSIVFKFKN